ncbi:MAG: NAD-dependent epimerase/dehydratase family protein [Thermoplasmata archaeon]
MKVLITGGSGFIGRHIVRECRKRGWETVSFDSSKKNSDSRLCENYLSYADLIRTD